MYNGTPLIWLPMGQNILAVLISVFFTRKCTAVLLDGQKSGCNVGFHGIVFNHDKQVYHT